MSSLPIKFLGIAAHVRNINPANPFDGLDIFGLSKYRHSIIYPTQTSSLVWLFLVRDTVLHTPGANFRIIWKSDDGATFDSAELEIITGQAVTIEPDNVVDVDVTEIVAQPLTDTEEWIVLQLKRNQTLIQPCVLTLYLEHDGHKTKIGYAGFGYEKQLPLTPAEMDAARTNPDYCESVIYSLRCDRCGDSLQTYAAFDRLPHLEERGQIWQHKLPEHFRCRCGSLDTTLVYLRESLHGMLRSEPPPEPQSHISYVRGYARSQINDMARNFLSILDTDKREETAQKFIEENKALLATFGASRLLAKPGLLGQRFADFGIVDSRGQLILIEIESPSMRLFLKNGSPSSELKHAVRQVAQWFAIVARHRSAVLEVMGLRPDHITNVKGIVIAGRSKQEESEHIREYLEAPIFNKDIDIMTYDALVNSMIQLSRQLG